MALAASHGLTPQKPMRRAFKRDDAAIMLQEFWKDGPHEGAPSGKLGLGVSICFACDDAVVDLSRRGGARLFHGHRSG
ncbi:MAG: winged helix-turn-helix domain-containing protein [Aquincola sp.]|nr:winged helix-turn-helix domain-containing protein [Aquincola sp.]